MIPRGIGLLGGTFDPVHCGHLELARAARRALGLVRVDLLPVDLARLLCGVSQKKRFTNLSQIRVKRKHGTER